MPSVLALRHLAFEDLGCFEAPLRRAGFTIRYHDVGVGEFPAHEIASSDLIVVLGGPIGVYENDKYPFLAEEIDLIGERLAADRPIMGICLGAQLMARALGARVYPGPEKEIGFAPIELTDAGRASCLAVFEGAPILHWHGDTFDLPDGARLLASTPICRNQAFSLGRATIAFQFHPEAGDDGFERWLIGHTGELAQAGKDIPRLRAEHRDLKIALRTRAEACIEAWLSSWMN